MIQLKVLQLRRQDFTQKDIADRLGTTRSNIRILEKRAHQNIARAERTLLQWMMIRAPITCRAKARTEVFDLPGMIFAAADEKGMRLAGHLPGHRDAAAAESAQAALQEAVSGAGCRDLCDRGGGGNGGGSGVK